MDTTTKPGLFKIEGPETNSLLESLGLTEERRDAVCAAIFDTIEANKNPSISGVLKAVGEIAETAGELAFGAFAYGHIMATENVLESILSRGKDAFHDHVRKMREN